MYLIQADHLNTPVSMTDLAGTVVWQASREAFGETTVTAAEGVTQNLRFPGQYFDQETGLHQNWNREYDPGLGRYTQSDPIGLEGGVLPFAYSAHSPMMNADPTGLITALEAFRHYQTGTGTPLHLPFDQVNTSGVDPTEFPAVSNALMEAKSEAGCCSAFDRNISSRTSYTTTGPEFFVLGDITLNLEGFLKVDSACRWNFHGVLKSYNDRYDFNRSSHRGILAEWLTTQGRETQGRAFEIKISGAKPISGSGTL